MCPDLDRLHGDSEDFGDLDISKALVPAEDQDSPFRLRDLCEGAMQAGFLLKRFELFKRVGSRVREITWRDSSGWERRRCSIPSSAAFQEVETEIACDRVQER